MRTIAPIARPMANATGRLRPARPTPPESSDAAGRSLTSTTGLSNLEQFRFLGPQRLVDGLDVTVRCLLELLLGPFDVVLAGLSVFGELVECFLGVPADVADRDPAVLGLRARHLDQVASPFLGQLRERHADD